METITIKGTARSNAGKGPARRSRMAGNIPAILYGPETKPQAIDVDARTFRAAMRSVSETIPLFDLEIGGKTKKVIVRELQRDPVTSEIIHVDFHSPSMKKPLHLSIPLHFVGTPIGVKTDGGIMQTNMRNVEISCLPDQIPDYFEVDVSELGIGDSIHVRDLDLPNVNLITEEQRTLVVISAPTVVKEPVVAEEAEEVEGAEAPAEGEAEAEATEGEQGEKKDESKG